MIDWTAVGAALVSVLVGVGMGIAWWQGRAAKAAKLDAEVAASGASRSIADAEHTLFKLLADRLTTVESDLKTVRAEQAVERNHARQLEIHIYRLENLMRKAGLEPPEREFIVG